MKVNTTATRRQVVEAILAPQLHTLTHKRTGKLLRLVAIPGSARGDYIRQLYAEAMLDLLDTNNLLVVRKPDPAEVYGDDQTIEVELDDNDLNPTAPPPPVEQKQRTYKRMRPGDNLADTFVTNDGTEPDIAALAPALVTDKMPDDTAGAHFGRSMAGMKPDDDVRASFERLAAGMKAREFVSKIMAPLLQRLGCTVAITDNTDATPDKKPTKCTVHIDLPRGAKS